MDSRLVQALFTKWFRRAHVIESKLFCIRCAIGQTKAMKSPNKREIKDLVRGACQSRLTSVFACEFLTELGLVEQIKPLAVDFIADDEEIGLAGHRIHYALNLVNAVQF